MEYSTDTHCIFILTWVRVPDLVLNKLRSDTRSSPAKTAQTVFTCFPYELLFAFLSYFPLLGILWTSTVLASVLIVWYMMRSSQYANETQKTDRTNNWQLWAGGKNITRNWCVVLMSGRWHEVNPSLCWFTNQQYYPETTVHPHTNKWD